MRTHQLSLGLESHWAQRRKKAKTAFLEPSSFCSPGPGGDVTPNLQMRLLAREVRVTTRKRWSRVVNLNCACKLLCEDDMRRQLAMDMGQ